MTVKDLLYCQIGAIFNPDTKYINKVSYCTTARWCSDLQIYTKPVVLLYDDHNIYFLNGN
jgi:hypothetical protein